MATWVARLDQIVASTTGESLQVSVSYFDAADTGFVTVLAQKSFPFALDTTQASMAAQIRATGRIIRAGQDAAATLLQANPVNTTIQVT